MRQVASIVGLILGSFLIARAIVEPFVMDVGQVVDQRQRVRIRPVHVLQYEHRVTRPALARNRGPRHERVPHRPPDL
jgi:hypothetical protein